MEWPCCRVQQGNIICVSFSNCFMYFPEGIQGIVIEDTTHPSMTENGEGEILPVQRVRTTKDTVHNTESGH